MADDPHNALMALMPRLYAFARTMLGDGDAARFDEASIAKIAVTQALSALAPQHREIISLIDIAGFSYGEAAALLNVAPGTIMSRIARARSTLLAAIEASTVRPMKSRHG